VLKDPGEGKKKLPLTFYATLSTPFIRVSEMFAIKETKRNMNATY
jgi:hypothetical protein